MPLEGLLKLISWVVPLFILGVIILPQMMPLTWA
jgi:hypothetical protein